MPGKNKKPRLVVLTGAGISAESGVKTFRDNDGLWENHRVEDVATPEAWQRNPELVLKFYNARRAQLQHVEPNAAHYGLVDLQKDFDVKIITQNVDDLHERAGSQHVLHLHGSLLLMRSDRQPHHDALAVPYTADIVKGQRAPDGGQCRPHIVWFGEPVPAIEEAMEVTATADIFAIVGTSMQVYPAAGLLQDAPPEAKVYVVDKNIPTLYSSRNITAIEAPATIGVQEMAQILRIG